MDNTIWTKILEIMAAPLTLIFGALATLAVQLIHLQSTKIIANKVGIANSSLTQMTQICQICVSAAQQMYKAKQIADRKTYALEMAKTMRDKDGLKVTDEIISHIIESQVWDTLTGPATVATALAATPDPTTATITPPIIPG